VRSLEPMKSPTRLVVLLRGVNVGSAKRISMSEFTSLLMQLGATEVRTVLNSGNAACTSASAADEFAGSVSQAIADRCGFEVDVLVRTAQEFAAVAALDPLGSVAVDASRSLVLFLSESPDASSLAALRAADLKPDQWRLSGRELYAWMPDGVSVSPLNKFLMRGNLAVAWTGRNRTTIDRIAGLL